MKNNLLLFLADVCNGETVPRFGVVFATVSNVVGTTSISSVPIRDATTIVEFRKLTMES